MTPELDYLRKLLDEAEPDEFSGEFMAAAEARLAVVLRNIAPALLNVLAEGGCDCPGDPHEDYCVLSIALAAIRAQMPEEEQ